MKKDFIFVALILSSLAFGNIQQTDSLSYGNDISANGNLSIGIGNGLQTSSFKEQQVVF